MQNKKILSYILTSYLFSWIIWLPMVLNKQLGMNLPVFRYQHFAGAFGPLAGALITSYIFTGRNGLKKFIRRVFNFKIRWYWFFIGIVSPFLLLLLAVMIIILINDGSAINWSLIVHSSNIHFENIFLIWLFWLITYGFGEETGWRGYLLPLLSKNRPTLNAAVMVSFVWMLWHFPMFFYYSSFMSMGFGVFGWAVSLIFGSILLAWITRNAAWSVVPTALWHATYNFIVSSDQGDGLTAAFVSMFVIISAIWIVRIFDRDLQIN